MFAGLDLIHVPAVIPYDSGTIVVSDKKGGGIRWTADFTMIPVQVQGKQGIRFTEKGHGTMSPYDREVQWVLEGTWLAGPDGFKPLDFKKTVTDPKGAPVATEIKHFDWAAKTVRYERQEPG